MAAKVKGSLDEAKRFILNLEVNTKNEENTEKMAYFFSNKDSGGLSLNPNEAKEFFKCVDQLHEVVSNDDIFDRKSIQNWFQEAILKSLSLNNQTEVPLRQRANEAIEELKEKITAPPTKWEVHISVEGLSVKGLPITFGNVAFRVGNKSYKSKIQREFTEVMVISPDKPQNKKTLKK